MSDPVSIEERARRYLSRIDPAISGSNGHDATYRAACVVRIGFDLDEETCLRLLGEWNMRCQPPWSEKELRRKITQTDRERDKDPGSIGKLIGTPPEKKKEKKSSGSGGRGGSPWKRRDAVLTAADDRIGRRPPPLPDVAPPPRPHFPRIQMQEEPLQAALEQPPPAPPAEDDPSASSDPYANLKAVYGSKRALWDKIVQTERETRIRWRSDHGRACSMPDTVWVDPAVAPELPDTIDGLFVRPEDNGTAGSVRVGWTGREP